ncbi:TetR/AcrR family transcriptional regulator [Nonomuraea muscovyensis]|uniref:AcrR family transcriptional regulator n=1 Tax=Nonomuraea muscovyensis TaxID=1124761 RepID=A0A7X0EZG8_9ACTN|nr:TetR/AcrR family transcriptional regulator [Nonomuraea muscovyensis]MBB6349788.1 AcrR family transcriptional regulator [Nonomuraea muscovyensis]MDF2712119.1 TetR family transcriptional regulator [Nonomuraea muscovyensis]
MSTRTTPGPRERLLDAAQQLTYSHGMGVGVDTILKAANVARRSLYEHFGGKDGLIAEVLRRSSDEDAARYEKTMTAAGEDPRERLLAVFDRLAEVIAAPDFRGCRYLAADLALADPAHPGHAITRAYRRRVHGLLENELVRLGHPRPEHAAGQLQLLIDGTLAVGATRPGADLADPAASARELAERILDVGHRT